VPPWPDLVIGASRRSAPVARWIKKQAAGNSRLVHLFHTQAPLHHFDLIITLPQYRLPQRANVLHLSGALNRIPPQELAAAARRWADAFGQLPRPHFALIVGGSSSSYELDPGVAARLGQAANAEAKAAGGSLLISTTPRTSAAAADALFAQVDVPAYRYRWQRNDPQNPYVGFLALADRFIVTVDSASIPVEACATGKPVFVFDWSRRPARSVLGRWAATPPLQRMHQALIYWGLVKPARDFDAYQHVLRARGLVTRLGEVRNGSPVPLEDELRQAVQRVRQLMGKPIASDASLSGANARGA